MHIVKFLTYHGVVVPVYVCNLWYIYNLEAIIRNQIFGFIGRLCKSCNTTVQTLENGLLENRYGILGLKCCILIDDLINVII